MKTRGSEKKERKEAVEGDERPEAQKERRGADRPDRVREAERESFPASDPPSFNPGHA